MSTATGAPVLVASQATDFAWPSDVVALPDLKTVNGEPFRVKIGLVSMESITPIIQGMPSAANGTESDEVSNERTLAFERQAREISKLGILLPDFDFESKANEGIQYGKVPWAALTLPDKTFLFTEILRVSGYASRADKEGPIGKSADFPADQGGSELRQAGSGSGAAGDVAERADAVGVGAEAAGDSVQP